MTVAVEPLGLGRSRLLLGARVDQGSGQQHPVEPGAELFLGQHPLEKVDDLSVHEGKDGGNRLDLKLRGDVRQFVRIRAHQDEPAAELGGELLQQRGQQATGLAPGGPEVDDDRRDLGTLNDIQFESLRGRVHDPRRGTLGGSIHGV